MSGAAIAVVRIVECTDYQGVSTEVADSTGFSRCRHGDPRAILAFSGALIAPATLATELAQSRAGAAGAWRSGRGGARATVA